MITLWSINRWLRFTGFRLAVSVSNPPGTEPTRVGFKFYGWSFLKELRPWRS